MCTRSKIGKGRDKKQSFSPTQILGNWGNGFLGRNRVFSLVFYTYFAFKSVILSLLSCLTRMNQLKVPSIAFLIQIEISSDMYLKTCHFEFMSR